MKKKIMMILLSTASFANNVCEEIKPTIAMLESSNRLNIVNSKGFLGKYQFGAMSLVDMGLVKRANYQNATYVDSSNKTVWKTGLTHHKFLSNSQNWTIKGGKAAFLANADLQDRAFIWSCEKNKNQLAKKGINLSDAKKLKSLLVASHLGGTINAIAYSVDGKDYTDSYGTKISKYFAATDNQSFNQTPSLINQAKKFIGRRYVWGGVNPNTGADCSGFTQYLFKNNGINLPRTAYAQSRIGTEVPLEQLQKGDLLFFNTDKSRGVPITHVGMYLSADRFIHAKSAKEGVTISSVSEYAKSFKVAKRVIGNVMPTQSEDGSSEKKNAVIVTPPNPYTASTNINMILDNYVINNGKYVRLSQIKKGEN